MKYRCPVCKFPELADVPADNNICPCCGTEFGFDDQRKSHAQLRAEWLTRGGKWYDESTPPPRKWNPYVQLFHAGHFFLRGPEMQVSVAQSVSPLTATDYETRYTAA